MDSYQSRLGATWPFYADVSRHLIPYFFEDGLPMTLLITTDDMQIQMISIGHNEAEVIAEALRLLGE